MQNFTPGKVWPDTNGVHINAHGGGVMWHDGAYYWFGEFKTAGEIGNTAQVGVSVYASTDLCHWQNRGIALSVSDDPGSPIARGCILERPKVIYNIKTRVFVMWFHLEPVGHGYAGARVGVAVGDTPTGPYQFIRAMRLNAGHWPANTQPGERRSLTDAELLLLPTSFNGGNGPQVQAAVRLLNRRDHIVGQMSRDMTLFVDDDGTGYHVGASEENATLIVSRLSEDFLDSTGDYVRVFPGGFHEAPALFKHAGQYWMFSSHCTGWSPNAGRLSVAPAVMGPWTELGNPCVGDDHQRSTTFEAQPTFVLPVYGKQDAFIFMADRWRPKNAIDGRYVWLPISFECGRPKILWHDSWSIEKLDR